MSLPPLGLLSLAALLPRSWSLRLVDMNGEKITDADILWADVLFTGGMRVQGPSIHQVVRRGHAMSRPVVVGGPAPTPSPEEYDDADIVFVGEAEGRVAELASMLEAGAQPAAAALPRAAAQPNSSTQPMATKRPSADGHREAVVVLPPAGPRPPMSEVPVPRYDLLRPELYTSLSVQYSRGCPFACEFCDIIAMFGNIPRGRVHRADRR